MEACSRIDPECSALHRKVALECIVAILRDKTSAEVFVLAFDGLLADQPSPEVFEQRTKVLAARFAPGTTKRRCARDDEVVPGFDSRAERSPDRARDGVTYAFDLGDDACSWAVGIHSAGLLKRPSRE